ncbi:hypothetical protein [Luteipulveratus mongoliensis]|uniref:Phosphotyrosine protein phosphatase I domain-containing protein n=1 Tax=Luteipulveratus mongoliensis TaxID=571913 RepID=A0A0K1JHM3_9MICO|nr:hypothetical protein [Luteipulveratus mongoliensis]AKU16100.1 hypothetical protein VV02_09895 [Luteipulveratus mongoliensis]
MSLSPDVSTEPAAGRILVVCTGNICRSPYIERLLAAELRDTGIEVTSAGTGALVGAPMDPESEKRLMAAGGDGTGFVARQLTDEMVRETDLVLTATREHRTEVVQLEPKGLRKVFAVADLSDLTEGMSAADAEPSFLDDPNDSRVARIISAAARRRGEIHARTGEEAAIVDPFRRGPEVFDQMAAQIAVLLPNVIRVFRD